MKEPTPPARSPSARRLRFAIGVAGAGLVAIVGAAWVFRIPLVDGIARAQLADMGLEADFELERLDLGSAGFRQIRIGPENSPDLAAARADIRFGWGIGGPKLAGVRLVEPALRLSVTGDGVSFGAMDALRRRAPGRAITTLPPIGVEIIDGRALIATPYGAVPATFSSKGRLTRDFAATANIAPTTIGDDARGLRGLELSVRAHTEGGALRVDAQGALPRLRDGDTGANAVTLAGSVVAPRRIADATATFAAAAIQVRVSGHTARVVRATFDMKPAGTGLSRTEASITTQSLDGTTVRAKDLRVSLTGHGDLAQAKGRWSADAARFDVAGIETTAPKAEGDFTFDGRPEEGATIAASGDVTLANAGVTEKAAAGCATPCRHSRDRRWARSCPADATRSTEHSHASRPPRPSSSTGGPAPGAFPSRGRSLRRRRAAPRSRPRRRRTAAPCCCCCCRPAVSRARRA